MRPILKYTITRIASYFLTIFIGITLTFILPRFVPIDPITSVLSRITAAGAFMEPEAFRAMRDSLLETFGLKGSLQEQYFNFLRRAITGDFGFSLSQYPSKVNDIIIRSLPWTLGLLFSVSLMAWVFGNLIGLLAGYYKEKKISKTLELFAIVIYPVPYYIMALIIILVFSFWLRLFPLAGTPLIKPSFSLRYVLTVLRHAFMPALSIFVVNLGWWFLSMRALSTRISEEDFVRFAIVKGLRRRVILLRYFLRNALLPQITTLAMILGNVFNGAILTEYLFAYPGIGQMLWMSVSNNDINLMMGIVTLSIIAVATSALFVDLIYPLIDPRIRYGGTRG